MHNSNASQKTDLIASQIFLSYHNHKVMLDFAFIIEELLPPSTCPQACHSWKKMCKQEVNLQIWPSHHMQQIWASEIILASTQALFRVLHSFSIGRHYRQHEIRKFLVPIIIICLPPLTYEQRQFRPPLQYRSHQ